MEVMNSATSPFKRRKVNSNSNEDDVEIVIASSPERSLKNPPSPDSVKLMSTDLEAESFKIEISKVIGSKLSGEKSNLAEILKSPRKKRSLPGSFDRKNMAAKVVPAEETEEFFTAAEKKEQKRFLEKYNFDIVKDVPLEGNYEWIRLK